MAIALIGQTLLLLAFAAALGGAIASFRAGVRLTRAGDEQAALTDAVAHGFVGRAPRIVLITSLAAAFVLELALVGRDYTLAYVQGRISDDLGLGYRLTALWSGQQGSLLLWLVLLAAYGTGMVHSLRRARVPAALLAHATGIVLAVATFFALLVTFVARPFEVVDELARDGAGMSPSLQNYWMAAHPPALYLGYVGVTIPFAIVIGALLARRRDDAWIATTRGWILASWCFLTLGLVLGARWAYEEIGWGGYWAWDPVENAALMPWLTSTALLHSVLVQRKRGMMRLWNVVLASLTFALSIFGTFITRSGVLSSVHSFVSSPVGWWFIAALAVIALASIAIIVRRRELLHARADVDSLLSREVLLLFNNLLLVALALVVLWGVVYPIMTAAFFESRISLEQPWYNFFTAAFGLPLAALLALAPIVAWRRTSPSLVVRRLAAPVVAASLVGGVLAMRGLASSVSGVAAVCLGTLVLVGIADDLRRVRRRRRIGAWIAHAGIALVVIAIAGAAWSSSSEGELRSGDVIRVDRYTLRFTGVERRRTASTMQTRATFDVFRGSTSIGSLKAGRDFHPVSGEVSNEVAVRHGWLRAQDLFVTVERITEDGTVQLKVIVNQLMPLLWLGGLLTAAGAIVAGFPERRRPLPPRDRHAEPVADDARELASV